MMASTAGQQVYYARPVKVIDSNTCHQMTTSRQSLSKESNENVRKTCNSNFDVKDKRMPSGSAPILPPRIKLSMPSVKLQRERFSAGTENVTSRRTRDTTPLSGTKVGSSKVASAVNSLNSKSVSLSDRARGVTPPPKLPPRTKDISKNATSGKDASKSVYQTDIKNTPPTPEPQPLTRTNVTKHDVIWIKDEQENVNDGLCPPLKHITPETTEELWEKYNPVDNLDSASDHSDSSADTMIMMTTDEEKRNEEKIIHSKNKYEAKKGQEPDGVKSERPAMSGQDRISVSSAVSGQHNSGKITQRQQSLEDFIDDGYGTNSSTSTTLSSSLSSLPTLDQDNSTNQGHVKKSVNFSDHNTIIPNPTPQPGTRGTWAVKRRAKIAERHETGTSLQEKLRELAIIEEEDNTQYNDNHDGKRHSGNYSKMNGHLPSNVRQIDVETDQHSLGQEKIQGTETTERDLRQFEGDLFDKFIDMDRNYRNYSGFEDEYSPVKEDSKVLYFQQKVLKQKYNGSDNYYNPRSYYISQPESTEQRVPDHGTYIDQPNLADMSKNMVPIPNLSKSKSGGHSQWQHTGPSNMLPVTTYTGQNLSYRSVSSGHGSMDESCDQNIGNMSCDNIFLTAGYTNSGMPQKDRFVSLDNINQNGWRTLFASSHDIYNMFQSGNSVASQLQRPASHRHSFHAMPSTLQMMQNIEHQNQACETVPRPRSSSASVSTQTKTLSSWNPFGSLLRKKNKPDQSAGNEQNSKSEQKTQQQSKQIKSDSKTQQTPKSQPVKQKDVKLKNKKGKTDVEISVHLRETGHPIEKTNGVPLKHQNPSGRNPHEGKVTGLPFKTITLMEDNGTKLSTLV